MNLRMPGGQQEARHEDACPQEERYCLLLPLAPCSVLSPPFLLLLAPCSCPGLVLLGGLLCCLLLILLLRRDDKKEAPKTGGKEHKGQEEYVDR